MNIGLCDDDVVDRKFVQLCLEKYAKETNLEYKLIEFGKGEDLLKQISKDHFDVFLLDIYMDTMTGLDVAKEIRKIDEDVLIVFITSSKEFALDGYRVNAADYLLKPISYDGICEMMQRIVKALKLDTKIIDVLSNRVHVQIKVSSIIYAEVFNTVCIIHTIDEEYKTYITLEEVYSLLNDERFIRCHRSFLINMDYVNKIEDHNFILNDEVTIPIGRKNSADIKKVYYAYQYKRVKNS